jgi:hypothetical protein
LFCPSAVITSQFAASVKGAGTQRKRWEHGHIDTIIKLAPRLLITAIAGRRWGLLALTLDLLVPPLSLLAILAVGILAVASSAALIGVSPAASAISATSLLAFTAAAVLAWINYGRDVVPLEAIFSIAPYILGKLSLYREVASGKTDTRWIRTDRTKSE